MVSKKIESKEMTPREMEPRGRTQRVGTLREECRYDADKPGRVSIKDEQVFA